MLAPDIVDPRYGSRAKARDDGVEGVATRHTSADNPPRGSPMAVLNVRNVPDALYRQAQAVAAARGITLGAYVIALMEADIARARAQARGLAALSVIRRNLAQRQRAAVEAQPCAADLIHAGRAERERALLHG